MEKDSTRRALWVRDVPHVERLCGGRYSSRVMDPDFGFSGFLGQAGCFTKPEFVPWRTIGWIVNLAQNAQGWLGLCGEVVLALATG